MRLAWASSAQRNSIFLIQTTTKRNEYHNKLQSLCIYLKISEVKVIHEAIRLRGRSAMIAAPVPLRAGEGKHCSTSGASQQSRSHFSQSKE
jgi:hypothetical protein